MGKTSSAAKRRYNDKAYDRLFITVPKGEKEEIKARADKSGESVNAYINRLLDQDKQSSP